MEQEEIEETVGLLLKQVERLQDRVERLEETILVMLVLLKTNSEKEYTEQFIYQIIINLYY